MYSITSSRAFLLVLLGITIDMHTQPKKKVWKRAGQNMLAD